MTTAPFVPDWAGSCDVPGMRSIPLPHRRSFSPPHRRPVPPVWCVDVRMHDQGGLALKEKLNRDGNTIPVIMITADEGGNARKQAAALGVAGFFHKPVDGRSLVDAIEFAVSREVAEGEAGRK